MHARLGPGLSLTMHVSHTLTANVEPRLTQTVTPLETIMQEGLIGSQASEEPLNELLENIRVGIETRAFFTLARAMYTVVLMADSLGSAALHKMSPERLR